MPEINFDRVAEINYWDQPPKNVGYLRSQYIKQIMSFLNARLLKVLLGQRRSGKSVILKQIISQLLAANIPPQNILYLNFELHEIHFIQNSNTLLEVIRFYFKKLNPQGKVYLFFDEIQEVEGWEKAINSYLANERHDLEIFITGSNAHLLSTELATLVTGRYVEIPVYPFSFEEFILLNNLAANRSALIQFIESSGIPAMLTLQENQQKISYISSLKDSILMNDIVKRFQIKVPKLLILLLDFIIDNIGHLFSFNAIVKKLNGSGINFNAVTISNYIHYLERTFLIHTVPRYDLKRKKILDGERKYYLNDLGFVNYFQSTFDDGINRKLENFVFLTLLQNGFTVYVGQLHNLEIDFVAEKNQQILYIQVTYLLHSEDVIKREYGNLEKINDHWPKWVVSLNEVAFPPKAGILHVPAWQLMERLK